MGLYKIHLGVENRLKRRCDRVRADDASVLLEAIKVAGGKKTPLGGNKREKEQVGFKERLGVNKPKSEQTPEAL